MSENDTNQRQAPGFSERLESLVAEVRLRYYLAPRRTTAFAAIAAVVLSGTVFVVNRAFSISCGSDSTCPTLAGLRDGDPLPEAIRIYDRDRDLLAEVAGPLRRALQSEEIPQVVADAFVAVEDRRFWEHDGVDARGVARAALRNVVERDISEGASTIPMQLVRTLWAEQLRSVGPWRRKVIEARTAPKLVESLGRERVLTLYLNAIYLGNGIYGIERASEHYFGKGVAELELRQVALLVGITRSPELYEPRRHPEQARAVRDVVLSLLAEDEIVPPEIAEGAKEADLGLSPLEEVQELRQRSHLTAAVTRELRRIAPDLAGQPGLSIYTTVDPLVQQEAEKALHAQLERIESGRYGDFESDSTQQLEGAALAMDASTGAVLAWIGGRDFTRSEFDRVDQARRQVGSLVKPFLAATALERGYGILDVVSADTVPISTAQGGWLPADHVWETELPLREALVRSSNRAAAHLGVKLGLESVAQVGVEVGLSKPIPSVPASSIGAFDASLLEMTAAFTLFSNRGQRVEPYLLESIEGPDAGTLWSRKDQVSSTPVISEATAFVVLDAMRAVVDRGTGALIRSVGYRGPAAGKTGTTNDGRDAWFIGMTPEMVAGVWIGFDQPRQVVSGGGGGTLAAPVWASWMHGVMGSSRPRTGAWIPPVGVERVWYDPTDGHVFGVDCRDRVDPGYHREAWVGVGRFERTECASGVRGLFDRLWRAIRPGRSGDRGPPP